MKFPLSGRNIQENEKQNKTRNYQLSLPPGYLQNNKPKIKHETAS